MQRKGLLPSPYGPVAEPSALLPELKRYGLEPKPRKWTRGGTARRARERAEAKARHHAERLARWRAEKVARVQSRVHKPAVARLGAAPAVNDLNGDGVVNVVDVQIVFNGALGLGCTAK